MKKLFVSHLIAFLTLILLASNVLAATRIQGDRPLATADCLNSSAADSVNAQRYWSYYQPQNLAFCAAADPTRQLTYWSYYQNLPSTTIMTDLSAGQQYWTYYQNSPASTIIVDAFSEQRYWSYYQNASAAQISLAMTSK